MGKPFEKDSACVGKLCNVILKCTQFDSARRFQSVTELQQALSRIGSRKPNNPFLAAVGVLMLLAVCVLFIFNRGTGPNDDLAVAAKASPTPAQGETQGETSTLAPTRTPVSLPAMPVSTVDPYLGIVPVGVDAKPHRYDLKNTDMFQEAFAQALREPTDRYVLFFDADMTIGHNITVPANMEW
jgi:hypothetical protein